ncbi:MAG: hypothetical protein U0Q12_24270, partial [Vicinamibacterales bacterium]
RLLFPARGSATGFWRVRFEPTLTLSDRATVEIAYEHRLRAQTSEARSPLAGAVPPETEAPYRLSQLDWSLRDGGEFTWRHEVDRANVVFHPSRAAVTIGRQAIGWGRGVLFGAVDLFAPFTPLEADREWRRGVDAVRADIRLSQRSSIDVVGAFGPTVDASTAAARARGFWGDVDVEVVAGRRARDGFVGFTSSATVGGGEIHGELAAFRAQDSIPGVAPAGHVFIKGVAGGSFRLPVGNGVLVYAEYHYSGFGAARASDLSTWFAIPELQRRYLRGDTQILTRHVIGVLASYEQSPLVTYAALLVQSPRDGSGVVAPSSTLTFGDRLSLVLSVYLPYGQPPVGGRIRSEYGLSSTSVFAQLRLYL